MNATSTTENNPPSATQPSPRTGRLPLFHPYLLASFPVITIWAGNIREVTRVEGIVVVTVIS